MMRNFGYIRQGNIAGKAGDMRIDGKIQKRISGLLLIIFLTGGLAACSGRMEDAESLSNEKPSVEMPENAADVDPQAPGEPAARIDGGNDSSQGREMQQYLRRATVQVRGPKYLGSGVIWAAEGDVLVIATAAHVTEDNSPLTVQFGRGDPLETRLWHVAERVDVAFLEVSLEEVRRQEIVWQTAWQDKECCDRLEAGETLRIMGSIEESADRTYGGSVTEPWIYLEDFDNYMLLGQAYAVPGVSGGGVFTQDGILVGILCGGNDADEIAVLPWSVMQAAYDQAALLSGD